MLFGLRTCETTNLNGEPAGATPFVKVRVALTFDVLISEHDACVTPDEAEHASLEAIGSVISGGKVTTTLSLETISIVGVKLKV